MIHELRIYHCMPGKLPAVLTRFQNETLAFFEKYGIRQIGFWTVGVGGSSADFYYIVEYDSMTDRDTKWSAFQGDPDWLEVRRRTEADGPIVAAVTNLMLQPTAFSPLR